MQQGPCLDAPDVLHHVMARGCHRTAQALQILKGSFCLAPNRAVKQAK